MELFLFIHIVMVICQIVDSLIPLKISGICELLFNKWFLSQYFRTECGILESFGSNLLGECKRNIFMCTKFWFFLWRAIYEEVLSARNAE